LGHVTLFFTTKLKHLIKLLISTVALFLINFYTLSFTGNNGSTTSMSSFQGKKVMLVNIASGSMYCSQLAQLQQLQQQYADSIVVIVFPSNSFGNENKSDQAIKDLCENTYHSTFVIAAKSDVNGAGINSVYAWLAKKETNGQMNAIIDNDFEKFIIGKDGLVAGAFSSAVSPLDSSIIQVINTDY
ncbi:MAG: hypothetical protein ABI091_27610, partial [Ferruginibacter sp.]